MAGIYVHIPFCASRCIYCGFYSSTRRELQLRYVKAVGRELQLRSHYLQKDERIRTIYLGGGTPSQLSTAQLQLLLGLLSEYVGQHNGVPADRALDDLEVTMECNPDDVTDELAAALSQLPVNRVSMGAQTFDDNRLRLIRRRHTAEQTGMAVRRLRNVGINNISIDLMFGFPGETLDDWHSDIDQALSLGVEHLSAYALSYEEGTQLLRLLEEGMVKEIDEELSLQMFEDLTNRLTAAGYEHYEISNFALPSHRSRHNSCYWDGTHYLGLGAAAHSYDGRSRQWNVDDVERYIESIEAGEMDCGQEVIDEITRYNELVMTALRTCEGLSLERIPSAYLPYFLKQAQRFLDDNLLVQEDGKVRLTRRGICVSNMVMSGLMRVENEQNG